MEGMFGIPASKVEGHPPGPKLAIWHLLLWMSGVAIVGAWQRAWYGQPFPPQPFEWQQLWWGPTLAVWGLFLAGLLLALRGLIVRQPYFPVTAGHWLLVIEGAIVVIDYAQDPILSYLKNNTSWKREMISHLSMLIGFSLVSAACVGGAFAMRDTWPWRIAMLVFASVPIYWAVENAVWLLNNRTRAGALSQFGMDWQERVLWASIIAMWLMAAFELYRRRPRDWLHWTGLIAVTARMCLD
jgi:hypothetical protein